jgi:uncharacterized YigZ family protein
MIDEYLTITENGRYDLKEKGSKFIGFAFRIASIGEADLIVQKNKKEYYDATHNCFAYRIGLDGNLFRFNDDGEPSGTAGKPILNAIDQLKVTDLLVIVNRYFGGTKLGVPGLIKTYHDSAYEAIKYSKIVTVIIKKKLLLRFEHRLISTVMHILSLKKITILEQLYDEHVNMKIEIRLSESDTFSKALFESLNGKIEISDCL